MTQTSSQAISTPHLAPGEVGYAPTPPVAEVSEVTEVRQYHWAIRWTLRLLYGLTAILIAVGIFWGTYRLYTRNIDFPYGFHPDENKKTSQILSHGEERNFNHPLLLLESTDVAMRFFDIPQEEMNALDTGRRVSAASGALAAVAAAFIGLAVGRLGGMIVVGVAVALCPHLLIYSHYLKEDAGLAMGIVFVASASCWFCRARGIPTRMIMAVLLGLAAAVAASSKYVGAMAAPIALLVSMIPPKRPLPPYRAPGDSTGPSPSPVAAGPVNVVNLEYSYERPRRLRPGRRWWMIPITVVLFLAAGYLGVRVINHRAFENYDAFKDKVESEYGHSTEQHGGVTMPRPNSYFLRTVGREVPKHVFVLAGVYLLTLVFVRREGWDLALILLAGGYLLVVSYSVIPFQRYALPTVVMLYLIAGVGVAQLAASVGRMLTRGSPRLGAALVFVLSLAGAGGIAMAQYPRTMNFSDQFANDSRLQVRKWIAENLKPPAVAFADSYVLLHERSDPRMVRVPFTARTTSFFLPDATGTPAMLSRAGVRYAVVCEMNYARFIDPSTRGAAGEDSLFDRRKKWYEDLFKSYPVAWSSDDSNPTESYTNPTIRVYDLKPATAAAKGPPTRVSPAKVAK